MASWHILLKKGKFYSLNTETVKYFRIHAKKLFYFLLRMPVIYNIYDISTYIKSGLKWCKIAQKDKPFLHDVVKLVIFTPR